MTDEFAKAGIIKKTGADKPTLESEYEVRNNSRN